MPDKHLAIADNANASINMRLGVQARHAALQQELKDSVPQFMEGQPFDLTASPSSLQRYAQDSWRLTNSLAALGGRWLYACSLDCMSRQSYGKGRGLVALGSAARAHRLYSCFFVPALTSSRQKYAFKGTKWICLSTFPPCTKRPK